LVYLGLGSNIGDKTGYINSAIAEISKLRDTIVLKSSSIYKTEPWGIKEQEDFLNSAIEIKTNLRPEELLLELKRIEKVLGRKNREKWNKREIDIDILFYDDLILKNYKVNIPHPEIQNRRFVLIPLCELNPGFNHPVLKETLKSLLNKTRDNSKVTKI
jgi:2-amino-4-hydroxy-6-hydroxymethyldihydropteridine diphosphokinase